MKKQNEPSVKEQVEKYMKDKYNEEFTVVGGGTEGWNDPDEEIYVRTKRFPNDSVMIRRGKQSGEMIDNYMDFLMKDKIEEVMNGIVSTVYPKSKVYFSTDGSPLDGTTLQMSVDEYIKYIGKYLSLSIAICVSDPDYKTNKDQKLEQLYLKFVEKQYSPTFSIIYVSDDKFALINELNLHDVKSNYVDVANWGLLRGNFFIDSDTFKLRSVQWEEIK